MTPELLRRLKSLDQNPRHKALFLLLLRSDGYVTSGELGKRLKVSPRTIKSDVKSIAALLGEKEIRIHATPSKGYRLSFEDEAVENETIETFQLYRPETVDSDLNKNVLYLLQRLLTSPHPIRIETLEEELFRNTSNYPNKELAGLRAVLRQYRLTLCSEPRKGLYITGYRFYVLLCMTKAYRYFDTVSEPEFESKDFSQLFVPRFASRKEIRKIICDAILKTRIVFSDVHMERFVQFFILLGNVPIQTRDIPPHVQEMDFDVRITEEYRLVLAIDRKMREVFPAYQACGPVELQALSYMAIMSTDLYRFRDCSQENYGNLIALAEEIRGQIIREMEHVFQISPADNPTLLKDLIKMLIPIAMKIKLGISDDVDLGFYTEHGAKNNPAIAQFVERISGSLKEQYGYECSVREKRLLFSAFHKYVNDISLDHRKFHIALIAINGRLSTQQLKFCAENHFASYIKKIDTKVLYELYHTDTSIYDCFFCMDYGKNMRIPYRPIFYFGEDMSDMDYYRALQEAFINVYDYDRILPPVTHIPIDSGYQAAPFEIAEHLDREKDYLRMETGTEKETEIYLNMASGEESIQIFSSGADDVSFGRKRYYVVIHLNVHFDQQKFRIILDFIDSIAEAPELFRKNCQDRTEDIRKFFNPMV